MRCLSSFLSSLIGRWRWQPPSWLSSSWRYVAADARRLAIGVSVLLLMAAVGLWYQSRPSPHYVVYLVTGPGLTEYGDKGIVSIKPLAVHFSEAAAPLLHIDKPVTAAIEIAPRIPGTWRWSGDKDLSFTPKNDWPIDQ